MKKSTKRKLILILGLTFVLAVFVFLSEYVFRKSGNVIMRNSYGEGDKTETYEVIIEGEEGEKRLDIFVEEQEYSHSEIQKIFQEVTSQLDDVILGDNESFDRVETDLNLVSELEGYPVEIVWELDSYSVLNMYGEIQEENVVEEGTLVEIRGTIYYRDEHATYFQYARVYPQTREGTEQIVYEIQQRIAEIESETRSDASFTLPEEVNGRKLTWNQKKKNNWLYVLVVGMTLAIYMVYREKEKIKKEKKERADELMRDYPGMINKFTMLLSTGTTVKQAWEKIVQNYEAQKNQMGVHIVYEEMMNTCREMQGGVSEAEAYERFGKRCGVTVYLKFGALLSQNLRKGSKGLSDILRVEAIQSFENRKSSAKRLGEETGTKLLMPMLGMLSVVFIIVMVPAFMTMKL